MGLLTIRHDFGPGFLFERCTEVRNETLISRLQSGKRIDAEEDYGVSHVAYFLGGSMYPWVLRLSYPVPTFDSGDRMFDSWHDLFIARDDQGQLFACFASGGYYVAHMYELGQVVQLPEDLHAFLTFRS